MATDPLPAPPERPPGVVLIAAILILEAVAIAVLAALSLVTIVVGNPVSVGGSVFMGVLLGALAAGLVVLAARLLAGFRWPRSPSLVVQLFLVILAFPYFTTGSPLLGFAFLVPAGVVIVALFSRAVVRFTVRVTGGERTL